MSRDPRGRTVTARVAGVQDGDRPANNNPVNAQMAASLVQLEGPRENVFLRFIADPDVAYLRIRDFGGQDFPQSIETAIRTLRDKGTEALILDLRGNGGGVDQYGALLVSQFTEEPFRYFDRIHLASIAPSFATWKPSTFVDLQNGTVADPRGGYLVTKRLHDGVAEHALTGEPFLRTLIVLIDGGTFSTAADVAAMLRHLDRATFVGEETGGTYEGNTSGLNALISLPHSGLGLKIPMYGYYNAVSQDHQGRGTQPDYPVEKTAADLLRGVDAQLEQAIAIIAASREERPR